MRCRGARAREGRLSPHAQAEKEGEPLIEAGQFLGRQRPEESADATLVDRKQMIDQRVRCFGQAAGARRQHWIQRALAGRSCDRHYLNQREPLIRIDGRIAHRAGLAVSSNAFLVHRPATTASLQPPQSRCVAHKKRAAFSDARRPTGAIGPPATASPGQDDNPSRATCSAGTRRGPPQCERQCRVLDGVGHVGHVGFDGAAAGVELRA